MPLKRISKTSCRSALDASLQKKNLEAGKANPTFLLPGHKTFNVTIHFFMEHFTWLPVRFKLCLGPKGAI